MELGRCSAARTARAAGRALAVVLVLASMAPTTASGEEVVSGSMLLGTHNGCYNAPDCFVFYTTCNADLAQADGVFSSVVDVSAFRGQRVKVEFSVGPHLAAGVVVRAEFLSRSCYYPDEGHLTLSFPQEVLIPDYAYWMAVTSLFSTRLEWTIRAVA